MNIWVLILFSYLTLCFITPFLIFVHNEGPLGGSSSNCPLPVNIFLMWSQVFFPAKNAYAFKNSILKNVRGIYPYVTCKGSLPLIPCGPVPKMESDSPWLLPICASLDFNRRACTYMYKDSTLHKQGWLYACAGQQIGTSTKARIAALFILKLFLKFLKSARHTKCF